MHDSRVATPETLETKFPHQRTQSMDSMSSGDNHPATPAVHLQQAETMQTLTGKRQVSVKPLDEPEEPTPYRQ